MKRILGTVLLLSAWIIGAGAVHADEVRIGYVDMTKVSNESKAGKRAKDDIQKLFKERQETLGKEEQQLKSQQQSLEKDKLVMTEQQRKDKQKDFEAKVKVFREKVSTAEHELQQKQMEAEKKIGPVIQGIIQDLAKEEKLLLVFEKRQLPLYAAGEADLTDKVIQRFDAKSGG
ncbi:MAG: OmpH family outer membrane protein [Gammaproteobacteria bacterium]|nr:OmpH family outer membrane protein [Gammaproteobacteria bacterium]